ncbi:MAG: hypothetical protein Q8R92_05190 [Deltaproteobacteria bacterium]|nr:hypothetical protein [Deltaproteobacteria bacterium]
MGIETQLNAARYVWLRDTAQPWQVDDALYAPCGLTPDDPRYAAAHAAAVDAAIDNYAGLTQL